MMKRGLVLLLVGGGVIGVIALIGSLLGFECSTERLWIDPVTGSRKSQVIYKYWPDSSPRVERSAIARWLDANEGPYQPQWHRYSANGANLFGQTVVFRCGNATEAYSLASLPEAVEAYVRTADDLDIASFVATMRGGDEEQREAAVRVLIDRGVEAFALEH